MRETVKETRGSLLAETLNIDTHVRYDSKRFRFYVGSNPTDVAKNIITEAEFELSDEESWELYGNTELTVGRLCSGKHVIEVIGT